MGTLPAWFFFLNNKINHADIISNLHSCQELLADFERDWELRYTMPPPPKPAPKPAAEPTTGEEIMLQGEKKEKGKEQKRRSSVWVAFKEYEDPQKGTVAIRRFKSAHILNT